jgi:3-methyladenine DNA glycosylase AlkD
MATVASILAELKSKGREQTRAIYARHGMAAERVFGVSTADMKEIAKHLKGQQALACDLYASGFMEAMYLAGMVADGAQMSRKLLNEWAEGAEQMQMISEYTVPWVALDSEFARALAIEWMGSKKEHIAAAGWCTYSGLVAVRPDEALDLKEIESLLIAVVKQIDGAQNRVRHCMNGFVIAVGSYVKPLLKQAKAAASQIGAVKVDMGDTACKVPLAIESIQKIEAAGRLGKKRKTIRC